MTLPTSASSSSSLHLLPSRSPLTVEASSAKPDILPFVLQAVMTDPIIAGVVTSTHQQDVGFEASPRRTKRPRQVRFDNKISGKKLAPFAAEVRSSMYYNVSYPINTNTPIRQKLTCHTQNVRPNYRHPQRNFQLFLYSLLNRTNHLHRNKNSTICIGI